MSDWKNVQYKDGKYRTSEGGGGGGSSTFAGLDDVSFSNLQNGQIPKYNSTTQKWENANESGSGGHTYSTTEQVIGTWIDGKPVYEITVELNSTLTISNSTWTASDIDSTSMAVIVDAIAIAGDGTNYGSVMADPTMSSHTVVGFLTGRNNYSIGASIIILRYTKTTDV